MPGPPLTVRGELAMAALNLGGSRREDSLALGWAKSRKTKLECLGIHRCFEGAFGPLSSRWQVFLVTKVAVHVEFEPSSTKEAGLSSAGVSPRLWASSSNQAEVSGQCSSTLFTVLRCSSNGFEPDGYLRRCGRRGARMARAKPKRVGGCFTAASSRAAAHPPPLRCLLRKSSRSTR